MDLAPNQIFRFCATMIDRNAPLRLRRAAELAFPDGGMSAAGLRRQATKGNLVVESINGRDFTTLAEIEKMREKCRGAKARDSGSGRPRDGKSKASGSSETDDTEKALAAAQASVNKLKQNSQPILPQSTNPRASATVTPLRS